MRFRVGVITIALLVSAAYAGVPGTFRGLLYPGADTKPGWVYIVGRNDTLRLVHIANASITYADEFPQEKRLAKPARALQPGTEVRVTAAQDEKGEWRASEIEIITLPRHERRARPGLERQSQ